jgi:hypothetical protein
VLLVDSIGAEPSTGIVLELTPPLLASPATLLRSSAAAPSTWEEIFVRRGQNEQRQVQGSNVGYKHDAILQVRKIQ